MQQVGFGRGQLNVEKVGPVEAGFKGILRQGDHCRNVRGEL